MLVHHFSQCYSRRCRRMVSEVADVISPSCSDHTKLSVRIQPWNCWGLCSEIGVGPPLFTMLQPEMLTDGVKSGRCDQPLMLWSHQTFCPDPAVKLLGILFRNRCWSTTFHYVTTGDANGWCQKWPMWSSPHAPITPNFLSGSSHEIVGDYVQN